MKFKMVIRNDGAAAVEVPCASLLERASKGSLSLMPGESGEVSFSLSGSDTGRDTGVVKTWAALALADLAIEVSPSPEG